MVVAKRIADLLTLSRLIISISFLWIGAVFGADGIGLAAWLLMLAWTADSLDGPLSRRAPQRITTWIGDHDLLFDIVVSLGLLGFLVGAGLLEWPYATAYLLLWALILVYFGFGRSLGMLLQAPIYGWFLVVSWLQAPTSAIRLLAWIALAVAITWPKFPREIVPGFLAGMAHILRKDQSPR